MNYRTLLTQSCSKSLVVAIVADINYNEVSFNNLLQLISSTDVSKQAVLLNYRVSWVMSHCGINFPTLFTNNVINFLLLPTINKQQHLGYMRNVIRACQDLDFKTNINPNLLNTAFDVATNNSETVAARAFAITTIENIGKHEPDILRELLLALNNPQAQYARAVEYRIKKATVAYNKIIMPAHRYTIPNE